LKTKHTPKIHKEVLEKLYDTYNRRKYISPDPLQFVWEYKNPCDREIVGLITWNLSAKKCLEKNNDTIILKEIRQWKRDRVWQRQIKGFSPHLIFISPPF
jgi:hypothetical protein